MWTKGPVPEVRIQLALVSGLSQAVGAPLVYADVAPAAEAARRRRV
jgi:hypothetical protein